MVARGGDFPEKLKHDAIIEVVFEMRFEAPTGLPELLYGRLSEVAAWKNFQQLRLPAYDIPPTLRAAQPVLRFAPVLQLLDPGDEPRIVRMGPQVLSYHRQQKYVGWRRFQPELNYAVESLFSVSPDVTISRLGLRYMNALKGTPHGIASVEALDLQATVADEVLRERVNINYTREVKDVGTCGVRIATPDFVEGPLPDGTTVFVDVDVSTAGDTAIKKEKDVKTWIEQAHKTERDEFFHLLRQPTIDALREA
jgi:uncharacterized protein (TIGR04255 family)